MRIQTNKRLGYLTLAASLLAFSACNTVSAQEVQVIANGETHTLQPMVISGTTQRQWVPVAGMSADKDVTPLLDIAANLANSFGRQSARNRAIEEGYEKAREAFRRSPFQQVFGYDLEQYSISHADSPFSTTQYEVHELRGSTYDEIIYARLYRDPELRAKNKKWDASQLIIVPRGDFEGVSRAIEVKREPIERFQNTASNPLSGDLFRQEMAKRLDEADDYINDQQKLREQRQALNEQAESAKAFADAQSARMALLADEEARAAAMKAADEAKDAAKKAAEAAVKLEDERKKKETEYAETKRKEAERDAEAARTKELREKGNKRTPAEQNEYDNLVTKGQTISNTAMVMPCGEGNNSRSCQETGEPVVCPVCNSIGDFRSPDFLGNYDVVANPGNSLDVYQFGRAKPVFRISGIPDLDKMQIRERNLQIPLPY